MSDIVLQKDLIYVAIIFNVIFSWIIINTKSSNVPCKSDLFDVAWLSFLQMLHQPGQPFVVNTSPFLSLQSINEVKRHAHHQFFTCLKLRSIIFEQFWMPCSNGGISLFIFIHHTLNNKWPSIWFWANSFNIPHCHQLNVILVKLLMCCIFFSCCTTSLISLGLKCFLKQLSVSILFPSSSRFVINGWHCRHCEQGILNWSGYTIVDDEFLFVRMAQ